MSGSGAKKGVGGGEYEKQHIATVGKREGNSEGDGI